MITSVIINDIPYISIPSIQEWISSMEYDSPENRSQAAVNEILEELETLIHDKK